MGLVAALGVVPGPASVCRSGGADDAPPRPRGIGTTLRLLRTEAVRRELALDDQQVAAIEALEAKRRAGMREGFAQLMTTPAGGRREELTGLQEARNQQYEAIRKELDAVLRPAQRQRLAQIELQQQVRGIGVAATLASEPVARALGLTEEEKGRLRAAQRRTEDELEREIERLRARAGERVLEILTPAERREWDRMVGEPWPGGPPSKTERGTEE
jgi:hypothetical protein